MPFSGEDDSPGCSPSLCTPLLATPLEKSELLQTPAPCLSHRLHTLCTFLNKGPGDHGAGCCVCCPSLPTSLRGVWGRGQGQLCKLEDPVGLHSDEEAENTPPPQALLPGEPQQRCHPLALGSHVNSSEKSLNPWLKQAYPSHTHLPHAAQCSRPSTGLGVCLLHYESGDLTF